VFSSAYETPTVGEAVITRPRPRPRRGEAAENQAKTRPSDGKAVRKPCKFIKINSSGKTTPNTYILE